MIMKAVSHMTIIPVGIKVSVRVMEIFGALSGGGEEYQYRNILRNGAISCSKMAEF